MSLVKCGRSSASQVHESSCLVRILCIALAATVGAGSGGCALSPQVFSDDLKKKSENDNPASVSLESVAEVTADIGTVQRAYISKVKGMSQLAPATSAALIGISALALYKGMTGGNSKDIV